MPPLIGTHQIDRFDAIADLQKRLKENPKSLADWVILGELAHEVAVDAPTSEAPRYFRMSREAYEKALALAPNNQGLKAAVQFARESEAGVADFDRVRDRATQTYLDARRRDLANANYVPAVRVYAPPTRVYAPPQIPSSEPRDPNALVAPVRTGAEVAPGATTVRTGPAPVGTAPAGTAVTPGVAAVAPADEPTVTPEPGVPTTNDPARGATTAVGATAAAEPPAVVANDPVGVRQFYTPYPVYQPFWSSNATTPYTFRQYSSAYYPPNYYTNTALPPMTVQGWLQRYPTAVTAPARTVVPVR